MDGCAPFCLSIHQLVEFECPPTFDDFWIMLLWTFVDKFLHGHIFIAGFCILILYSATSLNSFILVASQWIPWATTCLCQSSFISTSHTHWFTSCLGLLACCMAELSGCIRDLEPTKRKIFTLWTFIESLPTPVLEERRHAFWASKHWLSTASKVMNIVWGEGVSRIRLFSLTFGSRMSILFQTEMSTLRRITDPHSSV